MIGRDDWLDLTQETALDPEQPICDPHHHSWNYPTSRYLAEEFLQDVGGGHRILKTVFVECLQFYEPSASTPMQPIGETETVHQIAREAATIDGPDLASTTARA